MQGLIDAYWDIDGKTIRPEIPVATRKENFAKITAVVEGMDQTTYIKTVPTLNLKEYAYMDEFRNRDSRLYASMLFPFKDGMKQILELSIIAGIRHGLVRMVMNHGQDIVIENYFL